MTALPNHPGRESQLPSAASLGGVPPKPPGRTTEAPVQRPANRASVSPARLLAAVLLVVAISALAAADVDEGVSLPTDRARERQLDQVRRLLTDARWSDAAALCDEILAAPRDAFFRGPAAGTTRNSLKAEVARLLREQPHAARRAYELLHGPRAASALSAALTADDEAAIVAVARRWFETPAGRAAAVITAAVALENDRTAVAVAWLDRLVATPLEEPLRGLVESMRSVTSDQAELKLGERGAQREEARNPVVEASRPLVVPRFRVPLLRHPEEARRCDRRRQTAAAQGIHLLPSGTPVAVDGLVLVPTPQGVMAVDFGSGKRLWIQGAGTAPDAAAERTGDVNEEAAEDGVFEDATAAGLVVAGGMACAIERPAEALLAAGHGREFGLPHRQARQWHGGNVLVAYDLAKRGEVAWRLPAAAGLESATWYLGPPLAVGNDLYVLAEEKGEVRLDLIEARTGNLVWSQPLAEIDSDHGVTDLAAARRRMAGFSPALADGVLVCPLGIGTVIGIDIATRTLLWAHHYRTIDDDGAAAGLRRFRVGGFAEAVPTSARPCVGWPVIGAGRVFLAPYDSEELLCLDLREGTPAWTEPVPGGVQVMGVVGRKVLVLGAQALEALDSDSGTTEWKLAWHQAGGRPSGRGLVTPSSLLLPLDSAEVIEVRIADGSIVDRCPSRGGLVLGNLIAYRGEVISRSLDSLDAFHQVEPLEVRIQTASRPDAGAGPAPELAFWKGQLDLEGGHVARGLAGVREAAARDGLKLAPGTVAEAVIFGMRRDFPAAAPEWRSALAAESGPPGILTRQQETVLRAAVNGFLKSGDVEGAWEAAEALLPQGAPVAGELVADPEDPALRVSDTRWLRGRLAELSARGPHLLRSRIDDVAAGVVAAAAADPDPLAQVDRLEAAADLLGTHPAADEARRRFVAACDRLLAERGETSANLSVRRQLQQAQRPGQPAVSAALAGADTADDPATAWPLGRVAIRRDRGDRDPLGELDSPSLIEVPVETDSKAGGPAVTVAYDMKRQMLVVRDTHGRRMTEPLKIEQSASRVGVTGLPSIEATALGRLLFVRFGGAVMAYDLLSRSGQRLWTHAGGGSAQREVPFVWRHGAASRGVGAGGVPVGMIITEPDDGGRSGIVRAGRAWPTGVLHHVDNTLALLDPARGTVLWERHRLPPATDLVGDDTFVCVVGADGRESLVLSMEDGRMLHACVVPPRRLRLGACGRRLVCVRHPDGAALAESAGRRMVSPEVDLELFDPVSRTTTPIGTVPGHARAVLPGDDRLVVLAPDGQLTVFDLEAARVAFRTRLPEMPAAVRRMHVIPWQDRYLVIAGTEHPADGSLVPGGGLHVSSPPQLLMASDTSPPLTGAVWAVDRSSGSLLWPAPATIERHCLHTAQPAGLPVLVFCRLLHSPRNHESSRLSMLCLDRRTGHAVYADDDLPVHRAPFDRALFGCEIEGDPADHTVIVRELGTAARRIVLDFTGLPLPPQPPFRAAQSGPAVPWGDFQRLLEQLPAQIRPRRDPAR